MKIGVDGRGFYEKRTGMEQYAFNLYKAISIIDKSNEYFIYFKHNGKILSPTQNKNFRNIIIPAPLKFITPLWEQVLLPRQLKNDTIQVYHSPYSIIPLFGDFKKVITVHDLTPFIYPEYQKKITNLYLRYWYRKSILSSDIIISVSENTKKDIIKLFNISSSKIRTIYESASEEFCKIEDENLKDRIRKKYQLPDKFILFVGTLEPRKNITRLLKAFDRLKTKKNILHYLVLAGHKGWLYEEIFKTYNKLKNRRFVLFIDYVNHNDLPIIYNLSDIFLYPSLYEGFGLPLLEAMACGSPVISSNTSSIPEVVGDAGILVNPKSIDEVSNAIYEVIMDKALRESLIEKGYKQVQKFSWEKTSRETLEVFNMITDF